LGWACKEFGEEVKRLVNENNKKIEKTEKISKFLESVYGEEIYNDKAPKFIYGYSTGLAPNHPNIKKFMMKNHITKG
jgi:hypothetical protein